MKPGRHVAGVTLAYLAITLVMAGPYLDYSALGTASYPGDARLMIWTLAWNNHALLDGLPLFDANIFHPAVSSLRYNDPLVGIALFTLPIYAATRNPVLAYNIILVLAFVLNGLGMHALAYRHTRRHAAAFVGGVTYAFSFYMMLHAHGHLSLIWTWLLPVSFLLLDRWIARPTLWRAAAWGSAVVLQALASWYLAVIAIVATGVLLVWRHAVEARDRWLSRVWQFTVISAGGALVLWPFAAPYRDSLRRPELAEVRTLSADWASYLIPPENTLVGQWWLGTIGDGPRWIWGELTMFLGWAALALGIAGLAVVLGRRDWRVFGGYVLIAALGLALSFGPAGPDGEGTALFDALRWLPGVVGFRAPAPFGLLVLLGLSMLAACGAAEGLRRFGRPGLVGIGLLLPVMLTEWFVVGFPAGKPQPTVVPAIYTHPAVLSARALVSLPDYRGTDRWFDGADYLLYSTSHWRPIVNGYGRAEPPDHPRAVSHARAFPGPNNARTMRELGVDVVIVHPTRYPDGAADILAGALESPEYELVAEIDGDYLFRVRPDAAGLRPSE